MTTPTESQTSEFKLLTAKEAANRLGVKEAYIKRMCRERKLNGVKVGKFWRITEAALADFIASLEKANKGNGGFSKDAKDRIKIHAILRSREITPNSIEKLNQEIDNLKACMQTDDLFKRLVMNAKLRDLVTEREVKRMRLDEIPQVLNVLADSAYPGMRELINEDPEALEAMFAGQVNGAEQQEDEEATAMTMEAGTES